MKAFLLVTCIFSFLTNLYASSIYQLDLKTEASIITPTIILGSYGMFRTYNQAPLSVDTINNLSVNNINRFDRFATNNYSPRADRLSDYLLVACLISPIALYSDKNIFSELTETSIIIGETYLITAALVYLTKGSIERMRPLAYNERFEMKDRQNSDSQNSFFSAHTALAFSGAIITAKIYDDFYPDKNNLWIYSSALTLASSVGYLRIKSGKHFPTDVITGAIIGTGSAIIITNKHKVNTNKSEERFIPILNFSFKL